VDCFSTNIGYVSDHSSNVSDYVDKRHPFPCYKGRQINDTDLLRAID